MHGPLITHPSTITQPSNRLASHNRLSVLCSRRAYNERRGLKCKLDLSILATCELHTGTRVCSVHSNSKTNRNIARADGEAAT